MNLKKIFDAEREAKDVMYEHTSAYIKSVECHPKSEMELYEDMVDQCGYILTTRLLEGKYTLLEYNKIRNALAELLWGLVSKEAKDAAF